MRTKASWPRCLSAISLKTRPENGAFGSGSRVSVSSVFGFIPSIAGTSSGRGQVIDDRVEQRLNTFVLERRTGNDRNDLHRERSLSKSVADLVLGNLLALEVFDHQIVVDARNCLDELFTPLFGRIDEIGRNIDDIVLRALRFVVPDKAFHRDQVDDALEVLFEPIGICIATAFAPRRVRID